MEIKPNPYAFDRTLTVKRIGPHPDDPFTDEVTYEGGVRVSVTVPHGLPRGAIEDLIARAIANELRKIVNSAEYERIVRDEAWRCMNDERSCRL